MINWTHCNISAKVELQTILGELALHLLLVRFGRDSWAGFDSILFFYYVASSDSVFDNIDIDIDTGCFFPNQSWSWNLKKSAFDKIGIDKAKLILKLIFVKLDTSAQVGLSRPAAVLHLKSVDISTMKSHPIIHFFEPSGIDYQIWEFNNTSSSFSPHFQICIEREFEWYTDKNEIKTDHLPAHNTWIISSGYACTNLEIHNYWKDPWILKEDAQISTKVESWVSAGEIRGGVQSHTTLRPFWERKFAKSCVNNCVSFGL